jgi:hypothetical protein
MVKFLVRGSVRGKISDNHRTLSGAVRSMMKDHRSCGRLGGGSYSDARVYARLDGQEYHVEIFTDNLGVVVRDNFHLPAEIQAAIQA